MNRSDTLENTISIWRILAFGIVLLLVFGIYLTRLIYLQVIQGEAYTIRAEENRTQNLNISAPRGIIYDRNGVVLARNIPSYNIVITYADLPDDPGEIQAIYRELSALIKVPISNGNLKDTKYVPCLTDLGITQIVEYGETTTPFQPVKIKCDIDEQIAMIVQEKAVDWPGVSVEVEPVREYPTGELTASIIGYLGPITAQNKDQYVKAGFDPNRDKIGYAGVERSFQSILTGKNGTRVVEVDVAGKYLKDLEAPVNPQPGNNIRLTIDIRLQSAAEATLIDEINSWNRYFRDQPGRQMTSGVVIAINPRTGEILAMVSYPTYENNRMARLIPAYYYKQLEADLRKPLINHAVGDEIPAGSVFKLTTAIGALNEGIVTPETIIQTPGKIIITERYSPNDPGNPKEFVDWNWQSGGFGQLDFLHCIAWSSNVCFYKLGGGYKEEIPQGLGICRLGTYARALGYGDYPGTQLPEEVAGNIPDPTQKRLNLGESWTIGDTYITTVGQGYILATPLQVLLSAATIANDGKLMNPTILHDVLDGEGNVIQAFTPKMRWDITKDNVITVYEPEPGITGCIDTNEKKNVDPQVIKDVQTGMHMAVLEGTLSDPIKVGFQTLNIAVAGKTGTAEYCDEFARKYNPCTPGNWPSHAWTVAYAPFEDPEIAIVAFVYNGGEGASVAAPIIRRIMQAYFELKAIDAEQVTP